MKNKVDYGTYAQIGVIIVLAVILVFQLNPSGNTTTGFSLVSASSIIPTGIPVIYGQELGIMYDDVSVNNPRKADETIRMLGNIDRIETLEGADLERYIDILYNMHGGMSCEYCCGARSIIFENGEAACGCAHSYAMRGLTKYLIINHPDIFDSEILTEIGKWKVLFFPGIMQGKAQVMESQGLNTDYLSLTTNQYRDIEKGQTSGGMVGGC